jgi:hypothetical protein
MSHRKLTATTSNALLKRLFHWFPPVPPWKPTKVNPSSDLKIACVVGERLYQGLKYEAELKILTPDNWKYVIDYGKLDFVLMESIWTTATGHWHMAQSPGSSERATLQEIILEARRNSIPTVFWITKDYAYHEHYKNFAGYFDFVFCADAKEAEALTRCGVKAQVLLPCVQPAIYNPFRIYEFYDALNLNLLFDGWADLDRMGEQLSALGNVREHGLNIIESRYQMFKNRLDSTSEYRDCILGCVTSAGRIVALKYSNVYITHEKSISTQTTQQWMTLEAAASRLPIVHRGELEQRDIRKQIVTECPNDLDFLVELVRCREDDLYRTRSAHLAWRHVLEKHTFAHRLQTICLRAGIPYPWEEYPLVSIITPTLRPALISRCLQNYESQTYPRKELMLVFNVDETPHIKEISIEKCAKDIKLLTVPGELLAGACLNYGNAIAQGEYCFRFDDDDHYGKNYILDMVLAARSVSAYLFGKPPSAFVFQGESKVFYRNSVPPLCIISKSLLDKGEVWIGGNSMAGTRAFFRKNCYPVMSYGTADSSLLHSFRGFETGAIALMDSFNLVFERRKDVSTHTWKVDNERLVRSSKNAIEFSDIMV